MKRLALSIAASFLIAGCGSIETRQDLPPMPARLALACELPADLQPGSDMGKLLEVATLNASYLRECEVLRAAAVEYINMMRKGSHEFR